MDTTTEYGFDKYDDPTTTPPATCRTCGFSDCPGRATGDCPRWPARDLLDPGADHLFVVNRARELAAQMDRFNTPGSYPSNVELQSWAGAAAAILRMVADRD
jgi:hypothetical protein